MAKNGNKDNLDNGDAHGQNSFECVGVYLPKETTQRIPSARQLVEKYDLQAAFDEIDDLKEEILSSEKPNFTAAVTLVVKKMEAKGFLGANRQTEKEEKPQRKVIFEVIDANHKKPTNPPTT
jgi:hypothetical protein